MEKLLKALDDMESYVGCLRRTLEEREWMAFGGWLDLLQVKVAGFRANAKALEHTERVSDERGNRADAKDD